MRPFGLALVTLVLACGDKDDEDDDWGLGDGSSADGSGDDGSDDDGGDSGDDGSGDDGGDSGGTTGGGGDGMPDSLSDCNATDGDHTEINAVSVEGDALIVTVSYSGGCEVHDFVLCWPDQSFTEGIPIGAYLDVWHDAHGDMCEAYVTEARRFDLMPLRESYEASYPGGEPEISITLGGEVATYTW